MYIYIYLSQAVIKAVTIVAVEDGQILTHTYICYGVATNSRFLKIIGLSCKRALQKRHYSAKETYDFKEPTNCSHPVCMYMQWWQWKRADLDTYHIYVHSICISVHIYMYIYLVPAVLEICIFLYSIYIFLYSLVQSIKIYIYTSVHNSICIHTHLPEDLLENVLMLEAEVSVMHIVYIFICI